MKEIASNSVVLALDARADLAETPVWDIHRQMLFWVDIERGQIHRYDPSTGNDVTFGCGQMVGSIGLRKDGSLIAALHHGFYFIDIHTGRMTPIEDPEQDLPTNRFNDGQVDPAGRFWAGTMGLTRPRRPVGSLYVLDLDRSVRKIASGAKTSNGMAWSLDQKTMYYIDTHNRAVEAFSYDAPRGEISERRVIVRIPEQEGRPDGMAIDSEGMLWVAHYGGWRVCRYDPESGSKLAQIKLPAENVTSCAFGGADLKTLYITTASGGLSLEALEQQPNAGGIFSVELEVAGLPANRCGL